MLLLVLPTAGYSQADSLGKPSLGTRIGEDALTMLRVAGHTVSGPAHWESEDFLKAAGVAALIAGTALLERKVENLVRRFEDQPGRGGDAGLNVLPTGEGIVIVWRL